MRRVWIVVIAATLTLSLSSCGASQADLDKARAEGAAAQLEKVNADKAAAAAKAKAAAAAKAKAAAAAKAKAAAAAKAKAAAAAKAATARSRTVTASANNWTSKRAVLTTIQCNAFNKITVSITWQQRLGREFEDSPPFVTRNEKISISPTNQCPTGSDNYGINRDPNGTFDNDNYNKKSYVLERTFCEGEYGYYFEDEGLTCKAGPTILRIKISQSTYEVLPPSGA